MRYYTTDCIYEIRLQARGLGKTYAEEQFKKLKEIYKGGYTHAKTWRIKKMMYSEFIDNVRLYQKTLDHKWNEPTIEEYKTLIEPIYMYHPLQFNKEEIYTLYCIGGLPLFDDLKDLAMDFQDYEDKYNETKAAYAKAQYEREAAMSKYRKDK